MISVHLDPIARHTCDRWCTDYPREQDITDALLQRLGAVAETCDGQRRMTVAEAKAAIRRGRGVSAVRHCPVGQWQRYCSLIAHHHRDAERAARAVPGGRHEATGGLAEESAWLAGQAVLFAEEAARLEVWILDGDREAQATWAPPRGMDRNRIRDVALRPMWATLSESVRQILAAEPGSPEEVWGRCGILAHPLEDTWLHAHMIAGLGLHRAYEARRAPGWVPEKELPRDWRRRPAETLLREQS